METALSFIGASCCLVSANEVIKENNKQRVLAAKDLRVLSPESLASPDFPSSKIIGEFEVKAMNCGVLSLRQQNIVTCPISSSSLSTTPSLFKLEPQNDVARKMLKRPCEISVIQLGDKHKFLKKDPICGRYRSKCISACSFHHLFL